MRILRSGVIILIPHGKLVHPGPVTLTNRKIDDVAGEVFGKRSIAVAQEPSEDSYFIVIGKRLAGELRAGQAETEHKGGLSAAPVRSLGLGSQRPLEVRQEVGHALEAG